MIPAKSRKQYGDRWAGERLPCLLPPVSRFVPIGSPACCPVGQRKTTFDTKGTIEISGQYHDYFDSEKWTVWSNKIVVTRPSDYLAGISEEHEISISWVV